MLLWINLNGSEEHAELTTYALLKTTISILSFFKIYSNIGFNEQEAILFIAAGALIRLDQSIRKKAFHSRKLSGMQSHILEDKALFSANVLSQQLSSY